MIKQKSPGERLSDPYPNIDMVLNSLEFMQKLTFTD